MKYLWLLFAVCSVQGQIVMKKEAAAPPAGFPSSTLVHYWRLEEGFDTALMYDAVGSADFSLTGTPGLGAGILGAARDFDRTVPEYGNYSGTIWSSGDFTISAWFKTDNNANTQALISQGFGGSGNYAFRLLYGAAIADFRFSVTTNGAANTDVDTVGVAPTAGVWYHVACGFDDTANEIWIEVNGGTRYTTAFAGAIWTGANNVQLGRMQNVDTTTMDGLLDDVCYFNSSLSEADVEAIYASGAGLRYDYAIPTTTLLAHYPLDEASGNAADVHGSYTLTGTANITTDTQLGITGRDFSSTTDYLTNASLPASANLSVSGWIYHPFDVDDRYWFSNGAQAMGAASVEAGIRDTGTTIYPRIVVEDATDGTQFTNVSGSAWTPPAWRHIVVTRNVSGTEYRFFINGVLGGIDGDSAGGLVTASADGIAIGDSADGTGSDWIGLISNVSVYSGELDPGMVAELYGSGTPPTY